MILAKYQPGITIPSFDSLVTKAISDYAVDSGGNQMRIAIENFEGQVYRTISSHGMGAYLHLTASLANLGLHDKLASSLTGKDGFDSWFVTTENTVRDGSEEDEGEQPDQGPVAEILAGLSDLRDLPETERLSIIQSRIGQGIFRKQLIEYWGACAVTGASAIALLRASHIKPWRAASNSERLDPFNGLLLAPNLDSAFDAGYISFDNQGKIILSKAIIGAGAFELHIGHKLRINTKKMTDQHRAYLEHHRSEVFLG